MAKRLPSSPTGDTPELLPKASKACPACKHQFLKYLIIPTTREDGTVNKQRHCPSCRAKLHECSGKHTKAILLQDDNDSANRLVDILERHISFRNDLVFKFNYSERAKQLVHAYGLVERSKAFIAQQSQDYGITPYELVEDALAKLLEQDFWKITDDLVFVRNRIGAVAQQLFKEKRQTLRAKRNAASTYTDISSYYS